MPDRPSGISATCTSHRRDRRSPPDDRPHRRGKVPRRTKQAAGVCIVRRRNPADAPLTRSRRYGRRRDDRRRISCPGRCRAEPANPVGSRSGITPRRFPRPMPTRARGIGVHRDVHVIVPHRPSGTRRAPRTIASRGTPRGERCGLLFRLGGRPPAYHRRGRSPSNPPPSDHADGATLGRWDAKRHGGPEGRSRDRTGDPQTEATATECRSQRP